MPRERATPCKSINVVVRNNFGVNTVFTVKSTDAATLIVKKHALTINHMIYIEIDNEITDRWDRQRFKDENNWKRTDVQEMETIGKIVQFQRNKQ
jgi:hypothetical protein